MAKQTDSTKRQLPPHRPLPAPDGGWGWAVVVGAHMCIFFGVGWLQTISIYVVPLQEEFGSSSAILGWIVSSGLATTFLSGPLGGLSARKLGCRKACMLGGVVLGCGFVASVFAQTPLQLFFTIGLVTGVGCSLVHLSAHIAISQYFDKRHALANGLTWLGSSIGQFISAPLLQVLIDYYGWRGAMLIEGAFVFNTLVAAALFRPLRHIYKRNNPVAYLENGKTGELCRKHITEAERGSQPKITIVETEPLNSTCNNQNGVLLPNNNRDEVGERYDKVITSIETIVEYSKNRVADEKTNCALSMKRIEVDDENEQWECNNERRYCKTSTFFLDSPAVLVVCVVNFLMAYAIQGYYAHVVAKAVGSGISQDAAAFILSMYAIGSLFARLTHGWFVDRKLITPLLLYALALTTGCIGAFSAVIAKRYAGLLASAVVLGMSSGVFYPIIPVVMRSLVGLKRMGGAYGIAMVFDGCGVVIGGLMAGLIKDMTGSYDVSFIQAGVTFAVASASILAVIMAQKCGRPKIDSTRRQTVED